MAITPCVPCGCIPGNIQEQTFKQDVLIVLCAILAASGGGSTPITATPYAQVSVAAAAVPNAYASQGFASVKELTVINTTDADLEFQFDGSGAGIVHNTVLSNSIRTISFTPATATGPVYMRYKSAAPT